MEAVVGAVDEESPELIITDNHRPISDEGIRQLWAPTQQVGLEVHANAVAARASAIADRAGLTRLAELFEPAGRHRDDGKTDPRLQLSLTPVVPGTHESGQERGLITGLVGMSHGSGRRGFPHVASGLLGDDKCLYADHHALAATPFDKGLWDLLIERTHTAYGVWGCAHPEAVFRTAAGQVSGEGRERHWPGRGPPSSLHGYGALRSRR